MSTNIDTPNLKFSYDLIRIAQANYKLFLKSDNPKVKMLGILGDFGNDDSYGVVKEIIEEVRLSARGDFAESRHLKQLRMFVQLRSSIEQQFEKAMETINKYFREENDFLFRKGEAKGQAKGRFEEAIAIAIDGISVDRIAKFTRLSIAEIEKL
jgi:hypothetical protein